MNHQARHCPNYFAFNSPPKCRKVSEARLARAEHKAVVAELLGEKEPDSTEDEFLNPVTTLEVKLKTSI